MTKKKHIKPKGKVVTIKMTPSTTIGKILADLEARGVDRKEIQRRLRVGNSMISHMIKGSKTHDEKLGILAEMHGGFTERELKVLTYLEWLESAKGISIDDILEVKFPESSRKKRPKKAA